MNIIRVDSTASTNLLLKELASTEKPEEGTVLVTSNQTSGRGQLGNSWESEPEKNLTFSMILYPVFLSLKKNFLISELVALSIKKVLDKYLDHIFVKWPNDIYYKDKKMAGILIENEIIEEEISQSVIGIGLNVNQEVFESDAPNPVSMKQILGADVDLDILLEEIINEIINQYRNLEEGEGETISDLYHTSLYRGEGYHFYRDKGGNMFRARIDTVQDNGIIQLITKEGEVRQYAFKEVVFA